MAMRIRQILPPFYTDEITGSLAIKYATFYQRLWHLCSDLGIGPLSVAEIKAKLYPLCEEATLDYIEECLDHLEFKVKRKVGEGLIFTYTNGGKDWFLVPTFPRHQKKHNTLGTDKSGYPPPVEFELNGQLWMRKSEDQLQYDLGALGIKHH